jgi:hypothetical protein
VVIRNFALNGKAVIRNFTHNGKAVIRHFSHIGKAVIRNFSDNAKAVIRNFSDSGNTVIRYFFISQEMKMFEEIHNFCLPFLYHHWKGICCVIKDLKSWFFQISNYLQWKDTDVFLQTFSSLDL